MELYSGTKGRPDCFFNLGGFLPAVYYYNLAILENILRNSKNLRKSNTGWKAKEAGIKRCTCYFGGLDAYFGPASLELRPLRPMRFILFEWQAQQALRPPLIQIGEN